jgi:VanZ family protein
MHGLGEAQDGGRLRRRYWTTAFLITFVIAYGSLFPFSFIPRPDGPGAIRYLLSTWRVWDERGDLLSNILLYMPLGFFACLGFGRHRPARLRIGGTLPLGILLSSGMELAQYHDAGRVTSMGDVYANGLGTLAGAICGAILDGQLRWTMIVRLRQRPDAALLLAACVGYKLFPYVPVIDLHKYWHAVRPLLTPTFPAFDLARYAAFWLIVAAVLCATYGRQQSRWVLPLFAAAVLTGKVLIVDITLVPAEVAAVALVCALWALPPGSTRGRLLFIALLNGVMLAVLRLQPLTFSAVQLRRFGMVPFWGFMHGSMNVAIASFLEKVFGYGGLLWLLTEGGVPDAAATIGVATLLLATSYAETFLPGRSGELTDALMALLIGLIFRGLRNPAGPCRTDGSSAIVPGTGRDQREDADAVQLYQ